MYLEEIKSLLKEAFLSLKRIKEVAQYESKLTRYQDFLDAEEWTSAEELKSWLHTVASCESDLTFIKDMSDLEPNMQMRQEMHASLRTIIQTLRSLEISCYFSNAEDKLSAVMEITSGAGGKDAQYWALMLRRMYTKFCSKKGFKVETLAFIPDEGGMRACTLSISGRYAYGWLKREAGVHRMVRKSPFDNHKRHTSFASVLIYPEITQPKQEILHLSDLRIESMKASGAGGQHVNKTESAVRIVHIPTGIKVECQTSRSQHKNKENALKWIKSKLYKFEQDRVQQQKQLERSQREDIAWGAQVRSYILDKSKIKDLRTGHVEGNPEFILNGNLDSFIYTSLKHNIHK